MTKKCIVRRGNRRGGVFIASEDAIKWLSHACSLYFSAIKNAKNAMIRYELYGNDFEKRFALCEMKRARECRELCRALAAPRMVYREERP